MAHSTREHSNTTIDDVYERLHVGHKGLLKGLLSLDPYNGGGAMEYPPNGSKETLQELDAWGLVRVNVVVDWGRTFVRLTHTGHVVAQRIKQDDLNKSKRRAAKERALHNIGHAIQFLTALDTPSDKMLDQTIGRLVDALDKLQKVRKPEED